MIDYGLLVSMMLAFGLPSLVGNRWTVSDRDAPVGFIDVALIPAFVGLAVGRLTTLALDDPSSIGSIPDMLIIRSGVEFWPGVAGAVAAVLVSARIGQVSPSNRVKELAPLAMIGYASYEAACVFRDGCFGPESAIGIRPPGLTATMFPVGWIVAVAVVLAAFGLHVLAVRGNSAWVLALASIAAVASVRSVASIWLPHVGDGLTRQHWSSIVVAVASLAALVMAAGRTNRLQAGNPAA